MRAEALRGDAARIREFLRACRRRERFVLFARHTLASALALLVPVAILAGIAYPAAASRAAAVASWLASACVAGMAFAWTRTPSVRRIAAIADARLGLRDALVTSVQFIDADDAMSQLVLRDASARIAGQRPGDAFPFETTRSLRVAAGAAAIALLALGVVRGTRSAAPAPAEGRGTGAGGTRVSAPDPGRAAPLAGGAEDVPDRHAAVRPVEAARPTAVPPRADAVPADPKRPSAGGEAAAASGGAPGTATTGAPAEGSRRAGGARGAPSARGSVARVPDPSPATAAYRTAWSRAQSAVARERVPPEYRTYLKNYFTAIRPRGRDE